MITVGDDGAAGTPVHNGTTDPAQGTTTAASVISTYLHAQVSVIQTRESDVKIDGPDAVHKTRVATRRLRSTLRTFRGLMDGERTDTLRAELKWFAEMLGGPRDAEVLKERLTASLDKLPPEAVVGPVRQRLTHELDTRHEQAHRALVDAMSTDRYGELVQALGALFTDPPFLEQAFTQPREALAPSLKRSVNRVHRRWKAAQAAQGAEHVELVHEARKKAKASRYAFEAVTGAFDGAKEAAEAWEQVTEALGIAQDTVVARARLLELTKVAEQAEEPTFTYGALYQFEVSQQDSAHEDAASAVARAFEVSKHTTGNGR